MLRSSGASPKLAEPRAAIGVSRDPESPLVPKADQNVRVKNDTLSFHRPEALRARRPSSRSRTPPFPGRLWSSLDAPKRHHEVVRIVESTSSRRPPCPSWSPARARSEPHQASGRSGSWHRTPGMIAAAAYAARGMELPFSNGACLASARPAPGLRPRLSADAAVAAYSNPGLTPGDYSINPVPLQCRDFGESGEAAVGVAHPRKRPLQVFLIKRRSRAST